MNKSQRVQIHPRPGIYLSVTWPGLVISESNGYFTVHGIKCVFTRSFLNFHVLLLKIEVILFLVSSSH